MTLPMLYSFDEDKDEKLKHWKNLAKPKFPKIEFYDLSWVRRSNPAYFNGLHDLKKLSLHAGLKH